MEDLQRHKENCFCTRKARPMNRTQDLYTVRRQGKLCLHRTRHLTKSKTLQGVPTGGWKKNSLSDVWERKSQWYYKKKYLAKVISIKSTNGYNGTDFAARSPIHTKPWRDSYTDTQLWVTKSRVGEQSFSSFFTLFCLPLIKCYSLVWGEAGFEEGFIQFLEVAYLYWSLCDAG